MTNPWKLTSLVLAAGLAVSTGVAVRSVNADPQPNMRDALTSFESGLNSLQKATADKGGHRAKAIDLAKKVIAETKLGIQFDNRH